jgi:hypothetical protein
MTSEHPGKVFASVPLFCSPRQDVVLYGRLTFEAQCQRDDWYWFVCLTQNNRALSMLT